MNPPKVSVILPVCNGARHLRQALESLLCQTFREFELILLDDGSVDDSGRIGFEFQHVDPRVRFFQHSNRGVAGTLNRGLELARGLLLARMDADDIASPQRLEKQVRFMAQHPAVGILGSACRLINSSGHHVGRLAVETSDVGIKWASMFFNPFAHPSIMLRRSVLDEHGLSYSQQAEAVEDYELFARLVWVTEGANLPEELLDHRIHSESISQRRAALQRTNHCGVAQTQMRRLLPDVALTIEQVDRIQRIATNQVPTTQRQIQISESAEIFLDLWQAFTRKFADAPHAQMDELRRHVARRAAKVLLPLPLPHGWQRLVHRLLTIDPFLPLELLLRLPRALTGHQPAKHSVNIDG